MADTNVSTGKRERTTRRWFVDKDGNKSSRAHVDAIGFGVEFVGTETLIEANLVDYNEGVVNAAALFGLVTSITNAAGGADKSDEDRLSASQDRHEALLEGEWSADREAGMRTSDVVEAIYRIKTAAGKQCDRAAEKAKILANPTYPEQLLANDKFKATIAAIQAEKKQARAEALAAKVGSGASSELESLLA